MNLKGTWSISISLQRAGEVMYVGVTRKESTQTTRRSNRSQDVIPVSSKPILPPLAIRATGWCQRAGLILNWKLPLPLKRSFVLRPTLVNRGRRAIIILTSAQKQERRSVLNGSHGMLKACENRESKQTLG